MYIRGVFCCFEKHFLKLWFEGALMVFVSPNWGVGILRIVMTVAPKTPETAKTKPA